MKTRLTLKKIFLILFTLILLYLISMLIIIFSGLKDHLFKADLIVVLGSKVSPDGDPSLGLSVRLNKAIDVYNEGYAPKILVSGGTGKEGYDESLAMADYLIKRGVPPSSIIRDTKGNNTRATAKHAYEYMQQQQLSSVIIVSQYYHIARTKLAFKKLGIKQIGYASPLYSSIRDLYAVPREIIAYPIYALNIK